MPALQGRDGFWDLPGHHRWSDAIGPLDVDPVPLIDHSTRTVTIGSCFAEEMVPALRAHGVEAHFHTFGRMYNSASIRQELERLFGSGTVPEPEIWRIDGACMHPLIRYRRFRSETDARVWRRGSDNAARRLWRSADVVIITLGIIEAWRNVESGFWYLTLPHPQVFPSLQTEMVSLRVGQMLDDLERVRALIRAETDAQIILTVSPIPIGVTLRPTDVRVANTEGKARIRAAVSEFVETSDDVHYFPAYEHVRELAATTEVTSDDRRHLRNEVVTSVGAEFRRLFCTGLAGDA